MNSGNSAQYAKIHRNGDFGTLVTNVERFVHLRNNAGAATSVRLRAVLPKPGECAWRTRQQIAEFWRDRVDEIEYATFRNMGGSNGAKPVFDSRRVACTTIWSR